MVDKKKQLIQKISPPLDGGLVALLFSEFVAMERNFMLGNWEPTTLDGGQFCEVVARIIYHVDSGNLNQHKELDSCLKYVEDSNNTNVHFSLVNKHHATFAVLFGRYTNSGPKEGRFTYILITPQTKWIQP